MGGFIVTTLTATNRATDSLSLVRERAGVRVPSVKTGGCLIRHARCFILQPAESSLTQRLYRQMLGRIERLAWHPT